MFDIRATAELSNINIRAEIHGEVHVRAIDIKLVAVGVPAERLTSAIPDLRSRFYNGDQPILQEVFPLRVRHKLENIRCEVFNKDANILLDGCDVAKIEITPEPAGICKVKMTVQASEYADEVLDYLSRWLRDEVQVTLSERQLKLAEMEQ